MNFLPILTTVLEAEPTRFGGTASPDFTQYGILILSLLAAVGFLAWGFKRFVGGALTRKAEERALQVCDVLPMGGKQKLCVVRCYDRSFFLGVSDRHVDLIAELDAAAIGEKPAPLDVKHKDAFLRALKRVQTEQVAAKVEPEVTVAPKAPPVRRKKAVRRKPAAQAVKPARKKLDDGRGMLA